MKTETEERPEPPMSDDEIRAAIRRQINSKNYQPVKPKIIARQIGLAPEFGYLVRRVVRKMASAGELAFGKNHLVRAPGTDSVGRSSEKSPPRKNRTPAETAKPLPKKKAIAERKRSAKKSKTFLEGETYQGTFRRLRSAGGIVRLFPTGRGDLPSEIFIPSRFVKDAAQGDTVLAEILPNEPVRRSRFDEPDRPARSGRIRAVIKRDTNRFVGTFFTDGGAAFVEVDGGVFKRPVKVGDAKATRAIPGDKVVLEITHYPCHFSRGEGVIVEVLGKRGTPGLDTLLIMREYNLPEHFPEKVLREARNEAYAFEKVSSNDVSAAEAWPGRLDLRGETILTIDPEDARDFDDAVSLVRLPNRHWRLGVHIADVAHFVRPGSAMDAEARQRSTSVYLPDRVIPMLPEVISNSLASLQPEKLRPAKSVILDYTEAGILTHVEIRRSIIQSARRLSYEEADAFLEYASAEKPTEKQIEKQAQKQIVKQAEKNALKNVEENSGDGAAIPPYSPPFDKSIQALLKRMGKFAPILKKRRLKKGAIELSFAELKITLDDEGRVSGAVEERQTPARSVIEEFMLAANGAVAQFLTSRGVPFLRRIHPAPPLKKLERFAAFIRSLNLKRVDPACFGGDRFAMQTLLDSVRGTESEEAVGYACLSAMAKAVYSPESEGHYALAIDDYCHFTSPIRRYPDLTVHHLLDRLLDGQRPTLQKNELVLLGQHASERERHAEEAERELKKLKLIEWMSRRVGQTMRGVVTGIERFGFFVRVEEIPAEGLVRIDTLLDDYYHYDDELRILTGFKKGNIIRIGDKVTVEIRRADTDARRLDFLPVKTRKPRMEHPHDEI